MNIENLVIIMITAYFICSYLLVYRYASLAHRAARVTAVSFRFMWYERAAGTYVLSLPIFFLFAYLMTKVMA